MEQVVNYILQWGPSAVSIITMVATVIVAVKKVGKSNDENLKQTRKLESNINELITENIELKKSLKKILYKIHNIREEK